MGEFVTENMLSPMEEAIYNQLKELRKDNTTLNNKLKELKNLFYQYSREEQSHYHDKKRFGFLESLASSQYRVLEREKIDMKQKIEIEKMYTLANEIIDELLKREKPLEYAVYFSVQGKIYRTQQSHLNLDVLNVSKSNQSLRISASAFKKMALEQQQATDITKHYSAFINDLQETYTGQSKLPNKKINAGIIAEAFERHLQKVHSAILSSEEANLGSKNDWTIDEIWRLIKQSLGSDPWYTGGDVGSIQVKNIRKGNVRLTQFNTIEDIVNFLLYLGDNQYSDDTLKRQAKEAFQVLYNRVDDVADAAAKQSAEEILAELVNRQ